MSEMNYSYSFSEKAAPSSTGSTLLSHVGITGVAGPDNTILLRNRITYEQSLVRPEVADALLRCRHFKTIDAHTRHVCDSIPALQQHPETVRQTLEMMQTAGMLQTADAVWQQLTESDATDSGAPCRIFILTCDRPDALRRVLDSLAQNPVNTVIDGIWVIDDSRDAESLRQNANIASELSAQLTCPLRHFDLRARQHLIEHLKNQVEAASSAVDFLLSREAWGDLPTYGIARNLVLLLSQGYKALVLDDDVLAEAALPPISQEALKFGLPNDREALFYESKEALERHFLSAGESPLDLMLTVLGKPLSQLLLEQLGQPAALAGIDGKHLDRFIGRGARVLMTQCGYWGDTGNPRFEWIRFLPPDSIRKLLAHNASLAELFLARQSWLGYRGPTLTDVGTMSALTGLDNTQVMPPYIPAGRGEDGLFGIMLQRLQPESAVWNAGWAIKHEPVDKRSSDQALTPLTQRVDLSALAEWLGREPEDQWGLSPIRRLAGVSEEVQRLAETSEHELNALLAKSQLASIGVTLTSLRQHLEALQHIPASDNALKWRSFLEESQQQLIEQIQAPNTKPLADITQHSGAPDHSSLRRLGQSFAQALALWPEICSAAKGFDLG